MEGKPPTVSDSGSRAGEAAAAPRSPFGDGGPGLGGAEKHRLVTVQPPGRAPRKPFGDGALGRSGRGRRREVRLVTVQSSRAFLPDGAGPRTPATARGAGPPSSMPQARALWGDQFSGFLCVRKGQEEPKRKRRHSFADSWCARRPSGRGSGRGKGSRRPRSDSSGGRYGAWRLRGERVHRRLTRPSTVLSVPEGPILQPLFLKDGSRHRRAAQLLQTPAVLPPTAGIQNLRYTFLVQLQAG
jgi:hypothetical protein